MQPSEFWALHPDEFWLLYEAKLPPLTYGGMREEEMDDLIDLLEDALAKEKVEKDGS